MARNLHYSTMQAAISEAVAVQVVPKGWPVGIVVAMDVPNLCQLQDRAQDHIQG
ncbi:hypothetical protein D3C80_1681970 [compost metagenome]